MTQILRNLRTQFERTPEYATVENMSGAILWAVDLDAETAETIAIQWACKMAEAAR